MYREPCKALIGSNDNTLRTKRSFSASASTRAATAATTQTQYEFHIDIVYLANGEKKHALLGLKCYPIYCLFIQLTPDLKAILI